MIWLAIIGALLLAVVLYDLLQTRHTILRNFPIIGHFRYMLEAVGPELRQYIVTSNDEERPFSRDQRSWVYASAKLENNYFGFGTDNDLELTPNYLIVRHAAFPKHTPHKGEDGYDETWPLAVGKVLGGPRGRAKAFRPVSVVNVSAMSYGSLSGAAVEALNRGAAEAPCLHNTGEGGISPYHRKGGELIWQVGTGYFGCRNETGGFDLERFLEAVESAPVRAVEIKLSQGAKPGLGGVLPGVKVTPEIAAIRGVPEGKDCISPGDHRAFHGVDEMLDFVEMLAERSGLPIGIKSAIGQMDFWIELAERMAGEDRGVDFITIDGGEGGTGAAPLTFSDHVGLPFKVAFPSVYRIFAERGIAQNVVWIGSGRLGFPEKALLAFALGCDAINVAREAMMAIGCIQAQRCHTDHCPTGVTTHNKWLVRGLVPDQKYGRLANYVRTLRKELVELAHSCGVDHPNQITLDNLEIVDDALQSRPARAIFGYQPGWAGGKVKPFASQQGTDHVTVRLPTR
ncbi:MAG: FMN-binding glutamate synthase family protein [Thermoanaerobaculia bacterium]